MASSSRRIPLLLILCGLVLPGSAQAAEAGVTQERDSPPSGELAAELDEVDVIGRKLRELQREAIESEDRFYERFNTLNSKDDFDIQCRMEKATGTIIPKRQCHIRFMLNGAVLDGQEFHRRVSSGQGWVNGARLHQLWFQRREEYRQTAKALLEKHPDLLTLATERVRAREQYDRARKERHQDRIILFE